MPRTVAIITDDLTPRILGTRYFVGMLADAWESRGIEIRVTGGCHFVPADVAIMHVDTSVVGEEYLELAQRYPLTLNRGIRSILKSDISRHLVSRTDRYDGPVIVKNRCQLWRRQRIPYPESEKRSDADAVIP